MRPSLNKGGGEPWDVLWKFKSHFLITGLFSFLVNLLMLTAPIYMLQVYDRVLASNSEPTLVSLTLIVAFLFFMLGLIDHARGRVLGHVAIAFQAKLDKRVLAASMRVLATAPLDGPALAASKDLDAIKTFMASPILMALFDLPWTPLFLLALFIFHPLLGWYAVVGAVILITWTLAMQRLTKASLAEASRASLHCDRVSEQIRIEAEPVAALGMTANLVARWDRLRNASHQVNLDAAGRAAVYSSATKTFRMFLQSAILGLGAWLVLRGELSGGAMIAGSILMGRALQPIETAIGQWAIAARAAEAWPRLTEFLARAHVAIPKTELPRPRAEIEALGLAVGAPGEAVPLIRGLTFTVGPGTAIGVIGNSGSGKTTLARALTGSWPVLAGKIRLGGATLDQYDPAALSGLIGYLPQKVVLFEGTVAENISRMAEAPSDQQIVAAAQKAAAHEMILRLPKGYDTMISANGGRLSGGQIQRIGLARALYSDPLILVLDEPNASLDTEGSNALNLAIRAIKDEGGIVVIIAHRPAAIQECDQLMVLQDGQMRAFGPRDQVLQDMVKNHAEILRPAPKPETKAVSK
jgi:ATP-binding cassette subfamily C protein